MEKKNDNDDELISPEVILSAIEGNEKAVQEVLDFYDRLIHAKFKYISRRKGVNISYMPLDDMKQEVRVVLYKAIQKFDT